MSDDDSWNRIAYEVLPRFLHGCGDDDEHKRQHGSRGADRRDTGDHGDNSDDEKVGVLVTTVCEFRIQSRRESGEKGARQE